MKFSWFIILARFYSVPQRGCMFNATWKTRNSSFLNWDIDKFVIQYESHNSLSNDSVVSLLLRSVVSPPFLRSILHQQKSWSLLPPQPRNAIPESIASHSSLFFSPSLSLSLWPISGDSSSCRRRPKNRRGSSCWRDSRYKTRVLTAGHFLANTWRCIRRIKFLF